MAGSRVQVNPVGELALSTIRIRVWMMDNGPASPTTDKYSTDSETPSATGVSCKTADPLRSPAGMVTAKLERPPSAVAV